MAVWSSLVLAGTFSAGACGRSAPTPPITDRAPAPVTSGDAAAAPLPTTIDVALDGEAVCLDFRDANKLIVATEESGSPKGVHEVDAVTGIVRAAVDPDACSMARSPDGKLVLTTAAEPQIVPEVEVIDAAAKQPRFSFRPWPERVLDYDSGFRFRTRFFPDGDRIALLLANDTPVEATLAIWSLKTKRVVVELPMTRQLPPDQVTFRQAVSPGEALAISDDGRYVAAGNLDAAVHVFDLAQGGKELVLSTSLQIVSAVAFAPGGKWLAATGRGGTMTTFELPSGKQLARWPAPLECRVAAVSPDGQRIAVGCESDILKNDFPVYPAPRALRIYTVTRLGR
jgi:WD40 repeat protein